jgi:hypothetical protein
MHPLRPPLNPSQLAALRREDAVLDAGYPGQNVAYVDTWDGDSLTRTVVAASVDVAEFHRAMAALPPEVRSRIELASITEAGVVSV